MVDLKGVSLPKKREGRAMLSPRDPLNESLLCGLWIEAEYLNEMRQICKRWTRDRNRFGIVNRQSGSSSAERLESLRVSLVGECVK